MKRDGFQFSLRMLLFVVLMVAMIALLLRERAGRERAEDRARIAEAEAERSRQLADALNVMSITLDPKRIYIWDTQRGSLTAISRSKRQILWEAVVDLERHPDVLPVSPPQIDGNFVHITDTQGNRMMVFDARTGVLIEVRTR